MDVAKMGHSREAHMMLTRSAVPRLAHVLKSVLKDEASAEWIAYVDEAHLSTRLSCVGASSLDETLPRTEREHLAATLDLPHSSEVSAFSHSSGHRTKSCWDRGPPSRPTSSPSADLKAWTSTPRLPSPSTPWQTSPTRTKTVLTPPPKLISWSRTIQQSLP